MCDAKANSRRVRKGETVIEGREERAKAVFYPAPVVEGREERGEAAWRRRGQGR